MILNLNDIICANNKTFHQYINDSDYNVLVPTDDSVINCLSKANLEFDQLGKVKDIGNILSNHIFHISENLLINGSVTSVSGETFHINDHKIIDKYKNVGTVIISTLASGEHYSIDTIINFPIKETMILNQNKVYEGFTLFTTIGSDATFLIDNEGSIVHQWLGTNAAMAYSKLITEGSRKGQLIRHLNNASASTNNPKLNFGGVRGYIEILDWNSNIIWSYDLSGPMLITDSKYGTVSRNIVSHHDFCYNPINDSIFVMIWVPYTKDESISDGRPVELFPNKENPHILHEMIFEIEIETRQLLWVWNSKEHIGTGPNKINMSYYNNGDKEDIFHANAIDYNHERKELIISVRGYHEIWAISYLSHEIVWRWGNTSTYSDDGIRILDGQHNCQWITDGRDKGGILIFDNDQLAEKHSEIRTVFPVYNSDGTYKIIDNKFQPEYPEHSIKISSKVGSWFISGCQRLPNENTLTCNGPYGTFIEFNTAGEEVWRYTSPIELFSKPWPPPPQLKSGIDDFIVFDDTKYRDSMTFRAIKYSSYLPMFTNLNPLDIQLSNYETHSRSLYQMIKTYFPFMFDLYEKHGLLNYLTNPHANCICVVNENDLNKTKLALAFEDSHTISICKNKEEFLNLYEIQNILQHNIVHHQTELLSNTNYSSEASGRYELANQIRVIEKKLFSFYQFEYSILNRTKCINGSIYNTDKILIPELKTTGTIVHNNNSNFLFTVTPSGSFKTFLLSKTNTVVKEWTSDYKQLNRTAIYVTKGKLANHLIRLEWSDQNQNLPSDFDYISGGGYDTISIFNDDGLLKFRTRFPESDGLYLHHDVSVDEKTGSIWICANENLPFEESQAYRGNLPHNNELKTGIPILIELLPTLDETNHYTINWELRFKDLLNQGELSMLNHKYNTFNSNDFFHINKVVKQNDYVIVSCRTTSELLCFSYKNKKIVWRFCEPLICLGNHDPRFIDDNTLSLYNNGYGNPNGSITEITPSVLVLNTENAKVIKTIVLPNDMKSNFASGCTILDGKAVVCFSSRGCVAEFNMSGTREWLFVNPYTESGSIEEHSININEYDNRLHNICVVPSNYIGSVDETSISVFDVNILSSNSNDY